jgi:hypothetical protein
MIYHSLSEIFDSMDETRGRLRKRLDDVTSVEESVRPAPGSWSVAEITEHLSIIEERLSKMFPVLLMKAEAGGLQRRPDQPFQPVTVAAMVERSKREKYTAPETVRPSGSVPLADSLARLERSRESIKALSPRLEALDLTNVTYPHPVFGPLSPYQWLIFLSAHEDRHLRQIESIMASPEGNAKEGSR